jgi:hypothetical protein
MTPCGPLLVVANFSNEPGASFLPESERIEVLQKLVTTYYAAHVTLQNTTIYIVETDMKDSVQVTFKY